MIFLSVLFDLVFIAIVATTAWFVARRMVVDSAVLLLTIVISSFCSMVVFEPIAELSRRYLLAATDLSVAKFLWSFFAVTIFVLVFVILRALFSRAIGTPPELGRIAESAGCWIIGGLSGYVLAAFLLTVMHTLPGTRDFNGTFYPEAHRRYGPVMKFAPDYQFLAFVEYTCTAHDPLSGSPWQLGRPVVSAAIGKGHWPSFPIRYAAYREELRFLIESEMDDE